MQDRTRPGRLRAAALSALLCAATLATIGGPQPAAAATTSIYAAPGGSGTTCSQSAPCSITQAKANAATQAPGMSGDLDVVLANGTYQVSSPLTFTANDSGQNGHRIIWQPAAGAKPVISGGTPVTGWTQSGSNPNLWSAPVAAGLQTRQLYASGVRLPRSSGMPAGLTLTRTPTGYAASNSTLSTWKNPQSIELVYDGGNGPWTQPRCDIASISGTAITMRQPCWSDLTPPTTPTASDGDNPTGGFPGTWSTPSRLENAFELLAPGQWYLDQSANQVYYYPKPGETPSQMQFTAPQTEQLLVSTTTPDAPLHDVTFQNVEFAYATWLQPSGNAGFAEMQGNMTMSTSNTQGLCGYASPAGSCPFAAWTRPLAAVDLTGTRSVSFLNNRFDHLGGAGLGLFHGATADTVQGNEVTDVSSNGIQLGTTDDPQPPVNYATDVALGKAATQSSSYSSATGAALAVDGNTDGNFTDGSVSHTNSDPNAWWQVDLGASQLLDSINVFNRTDCCPNRLTDYWVFVSASPFDTSLTPVQQAAKTGVWSSHQSGQAGTPTAIPVNATGRYVMIQLAGTNYLSLAEVQAISRDPEIATGNTVSDNYIHNTGAEYTGAVGVFVGYARNTTVSHNQLDDLPYSGINVGWGGWHTNATTPDANPNINADNTVSDNLIFNVMRTRSDGGPIYTNGSQGTSFAHGLTLSGNVTFANAHTNFAYYNDEGGRYITNDGNVQYEDNGTFNGGCSTTGPVVVRNAYHVGGLNGYTCDNVGPASSFTDGGGNTLVAQNPLPGVLPTGVLQAAGLEPAYTALTTGAAPVVSVVSPISAGQVLVSGSGFTPTAQVQISGTQATTTSYVSSNYLTATLPAGTASGNVTVTTAAGTSAITAASFTYDPTKDLAVGKAATQSSSYSSATGASLAVDGNTDGNFGDGSVSHTNSDANAWWQVDLGSSHSLSDVNVFNRTDCCASRLTDYYVFVSGSPFDTSLTPVQQAAKAGVWSSHQSGQAGGPTAIPVSATGRYVMVQLAGTNYLALAEVQAIGT